MSKCSCCKLQLVVGLLQSRVGEKNCHPCFSGVGWARKLCGGFVCQPANGRKEMLQGVTVYLVYFLGAFLARFNRRSIHGQSKAIFFRFSLHPALKDHFYSTNASRTMKYNAIPQFGNFTGQCDEAYRRPTDAIFIGHIRSDG